MTADVELLPLYAELQGHPKLEIIKHYARANVSRATARLQAEIDALRTRLEDTVRDSTNEIEALRAEVEQLRAARIAYASEFPEAKDGGPDTGNIHTNIRSLKARAERLADALEEIRSRSTMNFAMHPDPSALTALLGDIHQIADAALARENNND